MSNYPDGISESTPTAPWNQGDPDPLICSHCQHEPDEAEGWEIGTSCRYEKDLNDPCIGTYESKRCTNCNSLACRCDDD